jgi:hypothetical protein
MQIGDARPYGCDVASKPANVAGTGAAAASMLTASHIPISSGTSRVAAVCPRSKQDVKAKRRTAIMKLATIGLAAALALTNTFALAQGAGSAGGSSTSGGSAASGTTTGSSMNGSTAGTTGTTTGSNLGNSAGSSAAGANSTLNPSGNSYINTSPSGSTLGPAGPGSGVGR